ncbi:MAG: hypothetical protein K2M47_08025 [Clostridiales bacterium]|nr:hypothetical protein [Clostridiales bacterium]
MLGACLDGYAYDEQCEGTRAWYTYKLLSYFNDDEFFFSRVQHKLRETLCWNGNCWEFEHLFDLALEFAKNGYAPAREFIHEIYRDLLDCIAEKKPEPYEVDYHRQWLEHICIEGMEAGSTDALVKIAADIGGLLRKTTQYDGEDFDSFVWHCDEKYGKNGYISALKAAEDIDGNIAYYIENVVEYEAPIYVHTDAEKKKTAKRRAKRARRIKRERNKKCNVKKLLRKMQKYDNTDREGEWHTVALDIVNKDNTVFPIEAYMYVYTGLCACCRCSVVETMHKHGLLTDELLQECRYDCYAETRELAERIIKN